MDNILDIEVFKEKLFKKAALRGFSDWEIYYTSSTSFDAQILNGEVREYKNSSHKGVSFRGTFNGKTGYSYTEKITEDAIEIIVSAAKENAIIKEEDEKHEILFSGSESYEKVQGISNKLNEKTAQEKINLAKEMEQIAIKLDNRIVAVDHCVVASGEGSILLANSTGLNLRHDSGVVACSVVVRAVSGKSTKVGAKAWCGLDFTTLNTQQISKEAVRKAITMLGATSIKSGNYNIILENKIATNFLSIFIKNFFAENVQKGFSLLKDKVGKKIATDKLTITDSISHPLSIRNIPFDSEGVAIKSKNVIQNGVLKTYLYNLKSAKKDGVSSTGNGYKPSFKSSVGTDINNFFVEPGTLSFKGILINFSGLVITNIMGLHSGASPISGDFSLQAEGFLLENGKIIQPVEQITIAGNFYDVLNNIEEIASDLYFNVFGQSIGSPSLLINGLKVSGSGG